MGRRCNESPLAIVAELADAHGSGPCTRKGVGVRVPSSAPTFSHRLMHLRRLIEDARTLGGHKTKKDAVTPGLAEHIHRRTQIGIIKLFGTIDYDPAYDYKAARGGAEERDSGPARPFAL